MDKITDFVKEFNFITGKTTWLFFLIGLILIFTVSTTSNLELWHQKIPLISFISNWAERFVYMGIFFLILSVFWTIGERINIFRLRLKYPISNLEKTFFLVDVKGNVFLLDMCRKEIRWVENWQTLSDLLFNGYLIVLFSNLERASQSSNFTSGGIESRVRGKLGRKFMGRNYTFGKGIRTRGIPGT